MMKTQLKQGRRVVSILLLVLMLVSLASSVLADSGPPWAGITLDDLYIGAGDPWTNLDTNVTVASTEGNFLDGYVEVAVKGGTANDQFQLVNGGLLTVSGNAVFYNGNRIGTIDNTYNGSNGRLRINFASAAPLVNAGFETGSLSGWTVDSTGNQMHGQPWAVAPTGWSTCSSSSGTKDTTSTTDEGQTGNTRTATVQTASKYSGSYALQLTIAGHVDYGCGTDHSPSILSSAFTGAAGDTISMWWNAIEGSDDTDVYGFVENVNTSAYQLLFHQTGPTGGWINTSVAINTTVCPSGSCNLQFHFLNGTFDRTGGKAVGSTLYIDDIVLNLASPPASVTDAMVEVVVENIQYRNTSATPTSPRDYNLNFKDNSGATGFNAAQIIISQPTPTADAGGPYSSDEGSAISLDGSGSTDENAITLYEVA